MTGSGGAAAASPSPASTGGHGGSETGSNAGSAGAAPPVGMGPPNVAPVGHGVGASGCPAGPFPAPMMLSSASVCADFPFAYDSNEGPTWVASQGAFFFSNYAIQQASGGDIIKYTPGGACELFIQGVGCNGLAVTADGNLLAACQQSRSLVLFDVKTRLGTTVVDNYQGMALDSPNDLVIHTNGTIYFTNPQFELGGRTPGVGLATFRIDPAGAISLIAPGACNGIALSPDQSKLYVLTFGQAAVWDLDPAGVPSNRGSMAFGGDGMAVDCAGNIYVSGGIFTGAGQRIGAYVQDGTNLAFGGADGTTLLVVGFGQPVRELKMNVPGLP
jgi:gluconolactonase